jgi:hypothetical protein
MPEHEVKTLKDQPEFKLQAIEEDNKALFEGYGAVFGNIDAYGDVIVKGAFKKSLEKWKNSGKKIPLLYQHNPSDIIGVITEAYEDDYGLYIKGEINLDTTKGKEVYSLMKQGALHGLSIGYETKQAKNEKGIRKLLEVELWEISIVTFPANELAEVVKVKAVVPYQDLPLAPRETPWDANKARQRIAKWASSDGSGSKETIDWAKYRKAFLWYNAEDPENFGSYKLPIADVIDGQLKAVPRAIFAVGAVLQGARGGVDIPDADKEKIKKIVEKYYAKLDSVAPWQDEAKQDELDIIYAKAILETKLNKKLSGNIGGLIQELKQIINELETKVAIEQKAEETTVQENTPKETVTEEPEELKAISEKLDNLLQLFKGGSYYGN